MVGESVSHYRVLSKLGGGGMGVVYEAEDTRLKRRVALKFLPEDTSSAQALARFRREAEAASALNHPSICTIYDIGEHAGRPFIVMEKLEGTTLSSAIAGEPQPVDRILHVGVQIADALAGAHAAGIIHRDVKPANIFITSRGDAKLLDFGLARLESHERLIGTDSEVTEALTAPGITMGTIGYMSPEQARGERVDARSDIFSLGAVLYEMATGRPPFTGPSFPVICNAILNESPPPPSSRNHAVPPELDAVILAALEKDRDIRMQSAAELRAQLLRFTRSGTAPVAAPRPRRPPVNVVSIAIAIAFVMVAVVAGWLARTHRAPTRPTEPRIAVLPFENLGAPSDAYFADGVADEIRGKLSAIPRLVVIARASSEQYKHTNKAPRDIAADLGVSYLLTGRIQWQKTANTNRIHLSPDLVEIPSEGAAITRWQETYDENVADVFDLQSRIATHVAQALQATLGTATKRRLAEEPTTNLAAYDAYLRASTATTAGSYASTEGFRAAAAELERAVALDPSFARAWARLSIARSFLYSGGDHSPQVRDAARSAAERSLQLDPQLGEAYHALGTYYRRVTLQRDEALQALRRGIELDPSNSDLVDSYGWALLERGQVEEALVMQRRATTLDPLSDDRWYSVSFTLNILKRPRDAREAAEHALTIAPQSLDAIGQKYGSYLLEGDLPRARETVAAFNAKQPRIVTYLGRTARSWLLDPAQRDALLRKTPTDFDGNKTAWATALAAEAWLRGDRSAIERFAGEADRALATEIASAPQIPGLHTSRAITLAMLGRRVEALQEAKTAENLTAANDWTGRRSLLLARPRLAIILGDSDTAITALQELVAWKYGITAGLLRIDPTYDSLRNDPRFIALERR